MARPPSFPRYRARYIRKDNRVDPSGHVCPKCKKEHHWSPWVFAHWHIALAHTCDCGLMSKLKAGKVTHDAP